MKPTLLVSFSGGRTSAYMSHRIKQEMGHCYNLLYVFANTGQEREETLEFVRECDEYFNLGVVWVEAVVHPEKRKGTTHKIVDFGSADRTGVVFEKMIQKYGIPNKAYPHCTRELKLRPIKSYMRSLKIPYHTAIGIRADEYRRVNPKAATEKIVYPLADLWCMDKQQINRFWDQIPFNLRLEEHEGNCSWCWKKSLKKHLLLIDQHPEVFNFPRRMEEMYPMAGPSGEPQVFFRGRLSTDDLFALSKGAAEIPMDIDDGCGESCEMYATE